MAARDPEMIRFAGIDPTAGKLAVVESAIHRRAAFEPIAKEIIEVDAPGPSSSDPAPVSSERLRRPIFPLRAGGDLAMTGRPLIVWTLLVFAAGAGTGLWAAPARSQAKARMWADALLRLTTDQIPRRVTLLVNDDHWEPGAETGRHRHPGPTVIYILEGELSETTPDGTATLKAGQAVWRAARQEHDVRNVSGRPARALAIHLDPAP